MQCLSRHGTIIGKRLHDGVLRHRGDAYDQYTDIITNIGQSGKTINPIDIFHECSWHSCQESARCESPRGKNPK